STVAAGRDSAQSQHVDAVGATGGGLIGADLLCTALLDSAELAGGDGGNAAQSRTSGAGQTTHRGFVADLGRAGRSSLYLCRLSRRVGGARGVGKLLWRLTHGWLQGLRALHAAGDLHLPCPMLEPHPAAV